MNKDFIKIDGITFLVEINMNTAEAWEQMSGKKLGQFEIESAESAGKGGVSTRALLIWLYCAVREGAEIDGKSFELDFLEFKRMCKPSVMTEFVLIFIKQYIGDSYGVSAKKEEPKPEKKKKSIRSLFASFVRLSWVK